VWNVSQNEKGTSRKDQERVKNSLLKNDNPFCLMRINSFRDGKGFLTVLPHNKNIYYVNIEERPLPSLLPFPAESIRLSEYDAILTSEHPRKPNQSPIQTALNNLRKQSSKTLDQI